MARMTLDQLEIFLATAEHLHFTKAAEALYITQPAVSAAIASLENEYGVKLFHRVATHSHPGNFDRKGIGGIQRLATGRTTIRVEFDYW
jgi:hypothetical protein